VLFGAIDRDFLHWLGLLILEIRLLERPALCKGSEILPHIPFVGVFVWLLIILVCI
jgi:hypothetical protein